MKNDNKHTESFNCSSDFIVSIPISEYKNLLSDLANFKLTIERLEKENSSLNDINQTLCRFIILREPDLLYYLGCILDKFSEDKSIFMIDKNGQQ